MLNLNSPTTGDPIFRASGLLDGVKVRGRRMSVSPSVVRAELLVECLALFDEMRALAGAQFSRQVEFITAAVDEYEAAIRTLAGLGNGRITEDRRDGTGLCPVCSTAIYARNGIVLCDTCNEPLWSPDKKLESPEGFCTLLI
jgi:hypothetical protein